MIPKREPDAITSNLESDAMNLSAVLAFGKMSEDLEYQSERLAEIQDKLNSVTSAAKE